MERVGEGAAFRECQDQDQIPKRRHESGRLGLYIVVLSERRAGGGEAGVRGEKKKNGWVRAAAAKKTACSDRR